MWYIDPQGVCHPLRYRKPIDVALLLAYIDANRSGYIVCGEKKDVKNLTVNGLVRICKVNGVRLTIKRNRMTDTLKLGVLKLTFFVTQINDIYIKGNEVYINVK